MQIGLIRPAPALERDDLQPPGFMMGVQLAALLLAGRGAAWLATGAVRLLEARGWRRPPGLSPAIVLVAAIAVLAPAWLQLGAF